MPPNRRISFWSSSIALLCLCALPVKVIGFSNVQKTKYIQTDHHRYTWSNHRRPDVGIHQTYSHNVICNNLSSAVIDITDVDSKVDIYEDDEQPHVKKLRSSMMFFVQYVFAYRERKRQKRVNSLFQSKKLKGGSIEIVPIDSDDSDNQNIGFRQTISELKSSMGEMIQLVNYDSSILVSSLSFLTLGALMESIIPHYYGQCLHCVTDSVSKASLMNSLVGLAVTSTLAALFTGMRGSLFWMAGSRANYSVRVKLHRNLLRQEAAFFDENEIGVLISRLNSDVNKIGMVISFHVNVVLRQAAQLLFGSFYLIKCSPKLSSVAYTGMILIALVSGVYGTFANSLADKVQGLLAKGSAVAETSFSMSETIRAFDGVSIESGKYENAQSKALDLEEVQAWSYGLHKFITDTLQVIMKCAVMYACWVAGIQDGVSRAKLTRFLFYVNFVSDSSKDVGDQWAKIQAALGASRSVVKLLQRTPKIRDASKNTLKAPPINISKPVIQMSDMTVSYEGVESPALSNINLDIQPGDRVAIVGRSGSGKSSMLRTILRFYDPSSGSVSLDDTNLKEISRRDLSKRVCVVEQEPHLFPVTILENVLYGIDKDKTDEATGEESYSDGYREAALTALDLAGLPIRGTNDLGLTLDTRVGDGGRTLSGGQRQRVAIARALVRNPDVLLLDEPTAALDSKSENLVVGALQNAMEKSRCMLMVTHRLGVIRSVDVNKVVVLEQGRIAEMGDPETLLRSGGIYSQLAAEQGIFPRDQDESLQMNGHTSRNSQFSL